jgi:aminomethyltransferase
MRTPFYDIHKSLGAKMVDFHGWEMPLQYTGIIDEHINTRTNVSLFDVSHMGRFKVRGSNALDCLQILVTNDVSKLKDHQAIYSPMCYDDGGIVDDLIIYRIKEDDFLVVVNSSNREKDLQWIVQHCNSLSPETKVEDNSDKTVLLAVQGPLAQKLMVQVIGEGANLIDGLKPFDLIITSIFGVECIISRTGYTGEDGFEIFFDYSRTDVWNKLMEAGAKFNIKPAGLGARDTLRIEAGLMLYGNDIDRNTFPLEVPLKWTVKLEKHEFVGRKALATLRIDRKLVGYELLEKRIARQGNEVFLKGDGKAGIVTSGTFSPTLKKSIGFCFVPTNVSADQIIEINIGGKPYEARVKESTRFYRRK